MIDALEALGPLTGEHVVLVRGAERFDADSMSDLMSELVRKFGDDAPLIIATHSDLDVSVLDPDAMRAAGWVRLPQAPA